MSIPSDHCSRRLAEDEWSREQRLLEEAARLQIHVGEMAEGMPEHVLAKETFTNIWWLVRATSFNLISIVKLYFHSSSILIPRYFHSRHTLPLYFHHNSIIPTCFHFISTLIPL